MLKCPSRPGFDFTCKASKLPNPSLERRERPIVAFSEFRKCHGPTPEEILNSMGSGHDSPLNIHMEAQST
jgi:hypothetical protein